MKEMQVEGIAHRIRSGEIELAATEYPGNGPRVLLIHGIGSSSQGWDNVIGGFTESFTPIAIDQRGHGASGHPDHGYLYDNYIDDLDAVLAHFGMDRPLIVGHSLGGIVALWWAARYPDRAAALVIEDSPLRSGKDFRPAFEGWLELNALSVEEATARYQEERPNDPEWLNRRRAEWITGTARSVFSELFANSMANQGRDRIAEIEGVTSPVLLIYGDIDTGGMVEPDDVVALASRLANVELAHLPGASHRIHAERGDEFLTLATEFLRRRS
jgi:pimeloyl-ACP methyl ester carboxylesterase